jgi:hypothetical protein
MAVNDTDHGNKEENCDENGDNTIQAFIDIGG